MKKKDLLVVSVTTKVALRECIQGNCSALSIEWPLYCELQGRFDTIDGVVEYEITAYPSQQFAILEKMQGTNSFDEIHFKLSYYRF